MNASASQDAIFRAQHVGASEATALFGCNPWLTEFELWHRKKGNIAVPEFNALRADGSLESERIFWGVRLEAAIIDGSKERYGYIDREPADPPLTNGRGFGGHPDRRVFCPVRGSNGIVETKMVDWLERKKWGDEPPLNYLVQANGYAGLDKVGWFDLLVLVGGNKLERFQYDFRPALYAKTEKLVEAFWQSIHANKPPKADYTRDVAAMAEIYADAGDTLIDLTRDNRMAEVLQEYLEAKADETAAGCRVDAAKCEILEKLGENTSALVDGYSCRVPVVGGSADKIITAEMVGQVIKGRAAHRRFYVKPKEIK